MEKYLIHARSDQENILKNLFLIARKTCALRFSIIDFTWLCKRNLFQTKAQQAPFSSGYLAWCMRIRMLDQAKALTGSTGGAWRRQPPGMYPTLRKEGVHFSYTLAKLQSRRMGEQNMLTGFWGTETYGTSAHTSISLVWCIVNFLCLYGNNKGTVW